MGWIQCKTPNTNDKTLVVYDANGKAMKDWYGWCLAVTQQAFGITKRKYASAIDCWNASKTKHTDGGMNIPIGYYVPVFYEGGKYGHVVICYRESYEKVKVWSSPLTHKPYFDYFEGDPIKCLDSVGKKYGCHYVGWLEILTDTRIIEWVNDPVEAKKEEEEKEKKAEEELDKLIESVEKPVENSEPSEKEDVENSNNLVIKLINRLINWLKSLIS